MAIPKFDITQPAGLVRDVSMAAQVLDSRARSAGAFTPADAARTLDTLGKLYAVAVSVDGQAINADGIVHPTFSATSIPPTKPDLGHMRSTDLGGRDHPPAHPEPVTELGKAIHAAGLNIGEAVRRAFVNSKAPPQPAPAANPEPIPSLRGDWYGYDKVVDGKFVAGFLLDQDQEIQLREVAKFNCSGLAKRIAETLNAVHAKAAQPEPNYDRDAVIRAMDLALRPFAGIVGKRDAPHIITIGKDTWTMLPDDFENARKARLLIAPQRVQDIAAQYSPAPVIKSVGMADVRLGIAQLIARHCYAFAGMPAPDSSERYDCGDWDQLGKLAREVYLGAADDILARWPMNPLDRSLLEEAAALFRKYEAHHRGKIDLGRSAHGHAPAGAADKARVNGAIAAKLEQRLAVAS